MIIEIKTRMKRFFTASWLLAQRKAYYAKFRTLLSPSQIQKMYDGERTLGKK